MNAAALRLFFFDERQSENPGEQRIVPFKTPKSGGSRSYFGSLGARPANPASSRDHGQLYNELS
jgi:hypothetical protein